MHLLECLTNLILLQAILIYLLALQRKDQRHLL